MKQNETSNFLKEACFEKIVTVSDNNNDSNSSNKS